MSNIILLGIATTAFIFLQIFLSKIENKWVGFVLPIITFGLSLLCVYSVATSNYYAKDILTVMISLLLFNIPTAVLLAIYAACRDKRKRRHALDKMSVQDLE